MILRLFGLAEYFGVNLDSKLNDDLESMGKTLLLGRTRRARVAPGYGVSRTAICGVLFQVAHNSSIISS